MAEIPSAENNVNPERSDTAELVDRFWYYAQNMFAAGSFNDYDRIRVIEKERHSGSAKALRLPITLLASHKPEFVIYHDTYHAFKEEVAAFLSSSHLSPDEINLYTQELAIIMGIGEYQFNKVIFDPKYPRTPRRMNALMDTLTARTDIEEFMFQTLEGCPKDEILRFLGAHFHKDVVKAINGNRIGMSICRSFLQESGASHIMDDTFVVNVAHCLIDEVRKNGPLYIEFGRLLAADDEGKKSANAYANFLPEWLVAASLPMRPAQFLHLLSNGWKA